MDPNPVLRWPQTSIDNAPSEQCSMNSSVMLTVKSYVKYGKAKYLIFPLKQRDSIKGIEKELESDLIELLNLLNPGSRYTGR